jgi:hypothetical protein
VAPGPDEPFGDPGEIVGLGAPTEIEAAGPSPITCTGTRLPLRATASTNELATAAPPSAIVPSRRCHALGGGVTTTPPSAAASEAAATPAAATTGPATVAAGPSSATVRGPVTCPAIVSRTWPAAVPSAGRITMPAASAPATAAAAPVAAATSRPSGVTVSPSAAAISLRRASISPRVSTPPIAARFGAAAAAPKPVAQGTPVSRSTVGPRSRRIAAGSTRASPPTGTTPPGQARITLAPGTISWTIPTAVAPIPSSITTTSGRCRASSRARSADAVASPTTS